ncbi:MULTISPECIES: ABC transporter ATP-binding protein [Acidovorax]|uniref:ABC transporter ATP-binding protein n=1 Tax=Acidovorax TaxID=12916 RepID=UPI0002375FF8|nr:MULTISPECIES: oligopeptide/dipeptide ABC transporter ATP-binding protein [Acidovorax]
MNAVLNTPQPMAPTDTTAPLLEIAHLRKHFGSGPHPVRAVDDVSFTIRRGETLGLVGESGSGKSTIGRLLTRLVDPTSGQMRYHGGAAPQDLAQLSQSQYRPLRSQIQIIFQDPYASLNPRMRIRDVLAEALDTHGLAKGAARLPRIHQLLEQVGLRPEHAERFPHEFSGGQRQRIGIARALAVEPQFIVADEPLSALDVSIQAQVVNLLGELKEQLGLTLLFISHDLDVVEYLCDRVVVLYLGRVMEIAPTEALYAQPQHPYTQALLAAAPIPDPAQRRSIALLQGDLPSPANPPSGCVFRTRCPQAEARCASADMQLREVAPGHLHACWKTAPTHPAP